MKPLSPDLQEALVHWLRGREDLQEEFYFFCWRDQREEFKEMMRK